MKNKDYIEANRIMWNETADAHAKTFTKALKEKVLNKDYTSFDEVEDKCFAQINLSGKNVAHLCCNNGIELISVKRAGAARCVGFDISDKAIEQAKELASIANADVKFIRSDVYEIDESYHNQFNLVYITIGAFGWLPDLPKFLSLVKNLLRDNGQIFIYEMHPVLNIFEPNTTNINYSYFDFGPHKDEAEPDYIDNKVIIEAPAYWFQHTLSDIINGLITQGFTINHFQEYAKDISGIFKELGEQKNLPPMSYSLIARKYS